MLDWTFRQTTGQHSHKCTIHVCVCCVFIAKRERWKDQSGHSCVLRQKEQQPATFWSDYTHFYCPLSIWKHCAQITCLHQIQPNLLFSHTQPVYTHMHLGYLCSMSATQTCIHSIQAHIMNINSNELSLCIWVHTAQKGLSLMAVVMLSPNEEMPLI